MYANQQKERRMEELWHANYTQYIYKRVHTVRIKDAPKHYGRFWNT